MTQNDYMLFGQPINPAERMRLSKESKKYPKLTGIIKKHTYYTSTSKPIKRCCVCRKTETKPTIDSKFADGFLSKECINQFMGDIIDTLDNDSNIKQSYHNLPTDCTQYFKRE